MTSCRCAISLHNVATFATEWRTYLFSVWGGTHRPGFDMEALGFTKEMTGHENDPVMEKDNPEWTDGAYFGPSRGHIFPRYARKTGMPLRRFATLWVTARAFGLFE